MNTAPGAALSNTRAASPAWVFFCMGALLSFAPLVRGGNRQIALGLLLAISLCVLAGILATLATRAHLRQSVYPAAPSRLWLLAVLLLVTSPIWLALIQLLPLDAELWSTLAGRSDYLPALRQSGLAVPDTLPLSLNPSATHAALWSALPVSTAFATALLLTRRQVDRLLALLLLAAGLQTLVAVLQFGGGRTSFFYFGSEHAGSVIGTFNNRNHLADFLGMCVPLWFYFALRRSSGQHRGPLARLLPRSAWWPLWIVLGFAMLVVVLLTQSRGGLLSTSVALLACGWLLLRTRGQQLPARLRWGAMAAMALFVLAALISVGLEGLASRVQTDRLVVDAQVRNAYAWSTLQGALHFWPWGSGVGTFESVFPRFQALHSLGYVEYAHNDYPQLLMELGLLALPLMAAVVYLAIEQLRRLRPLASGPRMRTGVLQRCLAGLAVLVMLMHSWVEFNMHIPALAITAAFLAGVFVRPFNQQIEEDQD